VIGCYKSYWSKMVLLDVPFLIKPSRCPGKD
jgi:hypothetical protein